MAILDMTGLDPGEYPEIDRVLSQEPLFPLKDLIRRRQEIMAAIPTQLPTLGWTSDVYGKRSSPFSGRPELHKGIDLAGTVGTPIYAPADGIVRSSCRYGRFGTYLSIVHGYGMSPSTGIWRGRSSNRDSMCDAGNKSPPWDAAACLLAPTCITRCGSTIVPQIPRTLFRTDSCPRGSLRWDRLQAGNKSKRHLGYEKRSHSLHEEIPLIL